MKREVKILKKKRTNFRAQWLLVGRLNAVGEMGNLGFLNSTCVCLYPNKRGGKDLMVVVGMEKSKLPFVLFEHADFLFWSKLKDKK